MQEELLDFAASNARAGFRLQRFELFNWGTFHQRVWRLPPGGENALLTGDIGSGKSTVVDALTTLLVPAQRITYNKAAGAEAKERSLRSYVLGYYKTEREAAGAAARAVALRDHNSYSVILGHFYNEGFDRHVTLAQVFWMKDTQGQPARFYVVADRALSIAEDFAGFGTDINDLRKRLRAAEGMELHDAFPPYGAAFRRRFGLDNEQALELFNQTVSMKSVGNLTEFVRSHMLEAFPVEQRIEALIGHFDDLNRAHAAVAKARAQIELLEPLVADAERHAELAAEAALLRACREALRPWFARLKGELLEARLEKLARELERAQARIDEQSRLRRERQARRDELKRAIADNGGDRLERIRTELATRAEQQQARRQKAQDYARLAERLELPAASMADTFLANRRALEAQRESIAPRRDAAQNAITETGFELRELKKRHDELQEELDSLRRRRSNLPAHMLALRERLCADLALDEQALPFAGELIQVREDQGDWEGAAERLLHGFGLSLLVPDEHYARVADWVERTHLRGRLVYFRIRPPRRQEPAERHPASLVRKLVIRPDSAFYPWLEAELARRFDYACCEEMADFRRERRAITRAGQIKTEGGRHEKDDRHRIDDRSRYVLGWSNEAKIAVLARQAQDLQRRMGELAEAIARHQAEQKRLQARLEDLGRLEMFADYQELDWRALAVEIERLERERRELEAESDLLRALGAQLAELERDIDTGEQALAAAQREQATAQAKQEDAERARDEADALLAAATDAQRERCFPRLAAMREEALGDARLTVESCDNRQQDLRDWLQKRLDAEEKRIQRLRERIIDAMRVYKDRYPLDAQDVDVDIAAAEEFARMLQALRDDGLPRFEARFKALLNENTIREVAGFQAQLNRQREVIRERMESINRSLHQIDYNPGRYIALLAEPAGDADVRDFQQELRACTEGALTGSEDEQYSEAKFLQVQRVIERFRGREGTAELDRRWTRKVTDVRNWFSFSASERWREDDAEHEHYTDSGGKSGGQKEKLAYTVLAASLAYQFGLEWGETRSRSFRFVVIDEAFGRGSDESARYGLELFRRLDLQLLIVTPLQKIHIIEPFVANVGFVHNVDGRESRLRNLSIEEYRAEKAARGLVHAESEQP
ncbi:ATP-binding protein [Alkalilimnicola sp. S0819]|uniref:ATP-binding protein n=1 Tax=Alkalilimnicola sp. S0819 TaxID=2613922 RepID=UPI0012622E01|nr:SbcC/MukB-like Walker B domain-containing protein [Alkalilimnicola sp. S0819]KAB7624110.1 ATP-dependent exonuclease SbcCD, C subunit-like protein [Alkalilimnicola sp. S0819]MPQ16362.1 ATP-dependent exonuclease SbcCD, C subunit-like protein [Alkalilimnicola sp. S0819]